VEDEEGPILMVLDVSLWDVDVVIMLVGVIMLYPMLTVWRQRRRSLLIRSLAL
jgi:hypothetical protein